MDSNAVYYESKSMHSMTMALIFTISKEYAIAFIPVIICRCSFLIFDSPCTFSRTCVEFVSNIIIRIYSLTSDSSDPQAPAIPSILDTDPNRIVDLIVSFDGAWQNRGTDRAYNSKSGMKDTILQLF